MSEPRAPQPPLSPDDDPNWALFWYKRLTALNSFAQEQHEAERQAVARNVDAPLDVMSRPENY